MKYSMLFGCLTAAFTVTAATADGGTIKTVFVIALENHNWTQPASQTSPQQIFQNPNAPFINSLVNGTAVATINGRPFNISRQVAYATNYLNVLSTPSGNNPHVHPSEPNYFWAEAANNFLVSDDDDPYVLHGNTNQANNQDGVLHLTTLLTLAGKTWRSYQEDIDLTPAGSSLNNVVLPRSQWTSPITSFSGNFVSGVNQFNGSTQYNYAVKHNPMALFTDTNGGNDTTTNNPARFNFAPLQQLFVDLASNSVADYNWITPDQYNDMHSALNNGFMGLTGDASQIRAGDNFLQIVVPMIMASKAYQDHGAIILWNDESEGGDSVAQTLLEIVISPLAHPNVNGVPFASSVLLTHSSDVRTLQKIFQVTKPIFLGDAQNANDLSSLFAEGVIPKDGDDD
jgi:phosphatidylinositol-3-phosphatase